MLEKTEGTIKNGQSRKTHNNSHTRHKTKTNKIKTQYNICWTPLYAKNTNNLNKT